MDLEFKGTKEELELKFVGPICIGIGTIGAYSQITANTILPETDIAYDNEKLEIESNMKLYAASKGLLEALQKTIIGYDWQKENYPEKWDKADDEHYDECIKALEKALK